MRSHVAAVIRVTRWSPTIRARCRPLVAAAGLVAGCGAGARDDGFVTGGGSQTGVSSATGGAATGSTTQTDATSSQSSSPGDEGSVRFDVGDDVGSACSCRPSRGSGHVWIADSPSSEVVKINTETMVEEGRYLTHPSEDGNPSRTSVSLSGRAMAVANRNGGVTKVWASPELCDPLTNGEPGLQTSDGQGQSLAWAQDDCVAWHTPFPAYTSQRPVAWAPGELNPVTCEYVKENVWTAGCRVNAHDHIIVHRLDGDSGEVLDTVEVEQTACVGHAAYGGASDREGNFWFSTSYLGSQEEVLVRVDAQTLATQAWQLPFGGYGITVDHEGRPWVGRWRPLDHEAIAARFNIDDESWTLVPAAPLESGATSVGGMTEDRDGNLWTSYAGSQTGVIKIDINDAEIVQTVPMGLGKVKGVSMGLDGRLWLTKIQTNEPNVIRYDLATGVRDVFNGITFPYTYSDMTGFALEQATCGGEG